MFYSSPWSSSDSVPTPEQLVAQRAAKLDQEFAAGKYEPFVWPYCMLGFYLVFAYLLFPPTKSTVYHYARYPIFAFCVYSCVTSIFVCRSKVPPFEYGIGLINAYACLWLSVHVIWRDTRTESHRLAWKTEESEPSGGQDEHEHYSENGLFKEGAKQESTTSALASARVNESAVQRRKSPTQDEAEYSSLHPWMDSKTHAREYFWQPLPSSFNERLDWITTMIVSLRGEGTTHGISPLPPAPAHVRASLRRNSPSVTEPAWISDGRTPLYAPPTRSACFRYYTLLYLRTYLTMDLGRHFLMQDPYFLGLAPINSPLAESWFAYLPSSSVMTSFTHNPVFAQFTRLSISAITILAVLNNLTSLAPLLGLGVLNLRPEPWLYPSTFGTDYAIVGSTGLAGWWGLWWHQMFRATFEAPHGPVCKALGIKQKSLPGKLLGLVIAFGMSALLHASGSYTLNGHSRPWSGSAAFFACQPIGILLEMGAKTLAKKTGMAEKLPGWVKKTLTFAWVHVWLYFTAPLLADDVARGGVWTTEPVPFSVVAGIQGHGWWRWRRWMMPRWHMGERWWKSGIAF